MYNDPRYFSVRFLKKQTATLLKCYVKRLIVDYSNTNGKQTVLSWLIVEPSLLFHEETLALHNAY